ncbi:MAG: hypothetical protein HQL69_24040 [Magnetococcales bacterium]|nr:hypothetical protein [Magnetococcales bacterium]
MDIKLMTFYGFLLLIVSPFIYFALKILVWIYNSIGDQEERLTVGELLKYTGHVVGIMGVFYVFSTLISKPTDTAKDSTTHSSSLMTREELLVVKTEINRMAPVKVDEGTEFVGAKLGNGLALIYKNRLLGDYPKGLAATGMLAPIRTNAVRTSCATSASRYLLSKGVMIKSRYYDRNGRLLGEFDFSIADCLVASSGGQQVPR